jgi:zinc transport system substrate-binding protein
VYPISIDRRAPERISGRGRLLSRPLGLFFLLLLWGGSLGLFPAQPDEDATPLKIVTSVFPLREFAREIAADRAEVSLLLPPGAGVHTWQPRASDILRLSSADAFIYIGAGLEPWISDLLKSLSAPGLRVLALAHSLPLQEIEKGDEEKEHDPHVWLDFGLDLIIVDRIGALLSDIDPAGAPAFQERTERLKTRIQALDAAYVRELNSCQSRTLLIGGHAAFGYLTKRYGLEQISLSGLSPDAEATPSRLMAAIEWGRKSRSRAVFMEANTSSRMAAVLARELQVEVLPLHPGANLNKKEWESGRTFFDIMEENLLNLKKGLACD